MTVADISENGFQPVHLLGLIPFVPGTVGTFVRKADDLIPFADGSKASVSKVLTKAEEWLDQGYEEIKPGVFRSKDGKRLFHMTDSDLTTSNNHAGAPHVNFVTAVENPAKPGKMTSKGQPNHHVFLSED